MALPASYGFGGVENPLAANWATGPQANGCKEASGVGSGSAANENNGSYWDGDVFGNDQYSQIIATVASFTGASVRCLGSGATGDGYFVYIRDATRTRINRVDNGVGTQILAKETGQSNANGDLCYIQIVGATLSGYVGDSSAWTVDDATYDSGYVGVYAYHNTNTFDDWEGGNLGAVVYEEILSDLAVSASSITDIQTFVNIVSDQITSQDSLADAQAYLENLFSLLESVSVVEAIQTYLATLNSVAQSVSSLTDLQTFVESLQSVAQSSSSIDDFIGYVESLSSLIQSISSIVDAQTYIQILNSVGQVSSSLADYQTYIETVQTVIVSSSTISDTLLSPNSEILLSTITSAASAVDVQAYFASLLSTLVSLSSVSDQQHFVQNLLTLIQSQVSITDQQAYIHQLQTLIVSSASIVDFLSTPDAEYLLSTILSGAGVYDYYKKPAMAETAVRFYMKPRQDFEFTKISPALILPVALGEGGLGLGPLGEGYTMRCTGFKMSARSSTFIMEKKM